MTYINYTIEKSCSGHDLLKIKKLPKISKIKITFPKLFKISTISFQDPSVDRKSFDETLSLWRSLSDLYKCYLELKQNTIQTSAQGETLTKLSEYVGISCGLSVMNKEFKIPLNRFCIYRVKDNQKRMDFEYFLNEKRYFHETKGTTNPKNIDILKIEINKQSLATELRCSKKNNGPKMSGSTGSITVFNKINKQTEAAKILVIDPPVNKKNVYNSRFLELANILRYYANIISITHHRSVENDILEWFNKIISNLEKSNEPPKFMHSSFKMIPKISKNYYNKIFEGFFLDDRLRFESIVKYSTFEEASKSIHNPKIFIGISNDVMNFIRNCQWEKLIEYRNNKIIDNKYTSLGDDDVLYKIINDYSGDKMSKMNFLIRKKLL